MARYIVILGGHRFPVCGAHIWELLAPLDAHGREPDKIVHAGPDVGCKLCH